MLRTRYPSLQIPASAPPDMRAFLEGVKERLEITTGDRGDPRDRLLTVRDVEDAGMATVTVRNKYATLSGGATTESVQALLDGAGDTGSFVGVSIPTLEQIDFDSLTNDHDFLAYNNAAARIQRVPYETLLALFLTQDSASPELTGNWAFTNESLPIEIRAEAPRLRFNEQAAIGETLTTDGTLWDWLVDSQTLKLQLYSDDESTSTTMLELARSGTTPQYLSLLNGTQLRIQDGSLASPGVTFNADQNTGLYRISADRIGASTGGVLALDVQSTQIGLRDGTLAVPMLGFQSDTNTGIYRIGADRFGLSAGGVLALDVQGTQLGIPDGTLALPAVAFQTDTNTGLYRIAADRIGLSLGGVLGLDVQGTQVGFPDGTLALPALAFQADTNTGVYRISADRVGISTGGVLALDLQSTQIGIRDGSAATPMLAFQSDVDTGLFLAGADALGVATGGAERLWITTSGIQTVDGTVSLPSYSFINDLDTGLYRIGSNNIGVSVGGAKQLDISTSGVTATGTLTSISLLASSGTPFVGWIETDQSADEQVYGFLANNKLFQLNTYTAGFALSRTHLQFTRGTGRAVTDIAFGNSTDNPTFTYNGTGLMTLAGGLTVTGTVTVPNTSFTYAKLQNVSATNRVLGRITAGAGVTEELTPANLVTLLATADGTGSGLDADLLDGLDSTAFARRTIAQTISGGWDFTTRQNFGVTAANIALLPSVVDGGTSLISNQENRVLRVAAEGFFVLVRVNGSLASPTTILTGDSLGEFSWGGYDGTSVQPQSARLYYSATEDWSSTQRGGNLIIVTTTTGTTTKTTRAVFGGNSTGSFAQFPSGAATQPGIGFASDPDNGLYLSATNEFSGATGGAQRFQVNSNAFQTTVPIRTSDGSLSAPGVSFASSTGTGLYISGTNEMTLGTGGGRRAVFDASGRSLFGGLTSSVQIGGLAQTTMQIGGTASVGLSIGRYSADATAPVFAMGKSRGTLGAFTTVTNGDGLARWQFCGADGTNFQTVAAGVYVTCAGTVSTGVVPAQMEFYVANTAGTFLEAMRLSVDAQVLHRDGTVALPSISLLNDTDCGLYRIGANQMGWATNGTLGLAVDATQRVYGTALHNNSSSPTGTTNQYIASGTYTPTLTNTTNVAASTAAQCQWMRVGNVVTVSGRASVDPTAAGAIVLGISLPLASNFGAVEDCAGTACAPAIAGQSASISADATNDRAIMEWIAVDLTNQPMVFTFTYEII